MLSVPTARMLGRLGYSVHAHSIYAGRKRFEYRTRRPARDVDYLAIYETGHAHAVTGIAKISGVLEGTPDEIWKLTKSFAGISAKYFKDYFSGKKKAFAYCISEAARLGREIQEAELEHARSVSKEIHVPLSVIGRR